MEERSETSGMSGMMLRPTILYHIIKERTPSEADFLSAEKRGVPQPADPALIRYWQGVSFEDTLEGARRKARRFRKLGTYIAEVVVAAIPGVEYEQSLAPGHYTVWAASSDFLRYVRAVHSM